MNSYVLILSCFILAIYGAEAYGKPKPKCPGKCLTVRCGAIPVCKDGEIFIQADYDCICCPYCEPVCDPEICDRVRCMSPKEIKKQCDEQGLIFVGPDRSTCNCCGKCVKKE